MIVTLDGPAGSGKSTVAKALARRLGFRYLDTGAMYRTVALVGMRRGVDWNDPQALAELAERASIELAEDKVLLDGEDVSEAIRSSHVTSVTRFAADNLQVRRHLVRLQRALAAHQDMVTEGRDQGTIAFPDAGCKIFLTAGLGQRAARRLADLRAQGETKTLDEVLDELARRDQQDVARSVGGLTAAPDAIEVCTDAMTVEQVVDCLEAIVRRRQEAGGERPPRIESS